MARKFVMQLVTEAGTIELVAQRAKSLHEALVDFSRKVPAIGADETVAVVISVIDRSLAYKPLSITLDGKVIETPPVTLEHIPPNAIDFTERLMALCSAIEKHPQFADLVDTPEYKRRYERANTDSSRVAIHRAFLYDLMWRYITERHIESL